MRNMAVLHSPAFSYPLPVLVRVLFNLLIFKGKILYYNKYSERREQRQEEIPFPTWLYRAASYIRSYKYKKVTYTTNGAPHFFRQIGQYLTFIARTTILHRQLFFYPHGLNKKKREVVSNFFRTFAI